MRTAEFDYRLPPELIAQSPAPKRDQSRLLVLHRDTGQLEHRTFGGLLGFLLPGDLLVLNNSRVIPARLHGINTGSGGEFEFLLLEENAPNDWWVMVRPGKRARVGTEIQITPRQNRGGEAHSSRKMKPPDIGLPPVQAVVIETNDEGHRRLRFTGTSNILSVIDGLGDVPLPPYITRKNSAALDADKARYQTVFAQPAGSIAAPTAGLHFTTAFLDEIRSRGVQTCFITLHIGLGTFAPVKTETVAAHKMHEERYEVSAEAARATNEARVSGRRVIAVGTTVVRVLETVAAQNQGRLVPASGRTRFFIHPPFEFRVVSALLTNFHLPRSTLLMLVSAFAAPGGTRGPELILSTYQEAVRQRYRFFSYGDAMLIL